MEKLKNALAVADDEYLTGLSNKGTVKRAYKDLETAGITANYIDDSAYVTVDNAQCVILTPIAESSCTCPSRSICRHIVTAILWLKKELLTDMKESTTDVKQEIEINPLEQELTDFPVEKLCKAMKKKYYNAFLEKARVGILPTMEELTTITVDIPEDNTTVKLLSPLEYSACTCHSKEFCKHKAAAILAWKLKHQKIRIDSLTPVEETTAADVEKLHYGASFCINFLQRILSDGLVRTSEDAAEFAESAAVICHNSGIPDGEKLLREIGNRLKAYASHSPEFSTDGLFSAIMDAYVLMTSIQNENDGIQLKELSGEFKSTYQITDELELIPVAQRKFSSMTGYEGDIYYFINKGQNAPFFLTYSDVRPTFYENNRRSQLSNAPWGLYGLSNALMNFEMRLTLPKLSGIKLSSSGDTKAVQICKPNLNQKSVYDKIYTDFYLLIQDNFVTRSNDENTETLVMLMPEKCISSQFSEITQTHTIIVEDYFGQRLHIKARYNSKTRVFFSQLAAVGTTMLENPQTSYVVFGNAYIENGQCNIYPIAVFDNIKVPKPQHENREPKNEQSYQYFSDLFRDLVSMLCDVIQCGINSFDLYEQIKDSADECERSGLFILSEKLRLLSKALAARNHTYSNDNTEVVRQIGLIYTYLRAGIKKTEIKCAFNNLYEREENKNESAQ